MSDEQMWSVLDEWFEDTDPQPPNARRTATRVMAQVPRTRQRGRWSPFKLFRPKAQTPTVTDTAKYQPDPVPATNGHTPTAIGRTTSMLSPAKAITAGALVFAIGGAFLIGKPFDQQGSVPAAEADTERAAPVEFTASWRSGPQVRSGTTDLTDGAVSGVGVAWRFAAISEATDPRLRGTLSMAANDDSYSGGQQVRQHAFRIENEDGAWQQIPTPSITFPDGEVTSTVGVLVGEGGYDGLIAVFEQQTHRDTSYEVDLRGYVIEGDLPPAPEPLVAE